jgi:hypothetical protein
VTVAAMVSGLCLGPSLIQHSTDYKNFMYAE